MSDVKSNSSTAMDELAPAIIDTWTENLDIAHTWTENLAISHSSQIPEDEKLAVE